MNNIRALKLVLGLLQVVGTVTTKGINLVLGLLLVVGTVKTKYIECTSGNWGTSGQHLGAPVFQLPRFPSAICVWIHGVDLSASASVCRLPLFEGTPVFGSGLY